jgi:integrator complex subunit 5
MIKQNLLKELQFFVNGVSNFHRSVSPETTQKLVKCSLSLLIDLPNSRELIFEFFSLVFDVSVGNYAIMSDVSVLNL